jgi:uncharacterized GH25 family protein
MGFTKLAMVLFALLIRNPVLALAEAPPVIVVRVIDAQGKPAKGAEVRARYLASIRQEGKVYQVPMELAPPQTTDVNGRCELVPRDVSWSLAGLNAHHVEMTTDEAMELYDNAPEAPDERQAFEAMVNDQLQRYSTAYRELTPSLDLRQPITLRLEKAIKVSGRVQVNGRPLAGAFVTISSRKTAVDKLFARWAPELTDQNGSFSYYAIPGDLDRAKITVERPGSNRILNLTNVPSKRTSDGLLFEFNTQAKDYERVGDD